MHAFSFPAAICRFDDCRLTAGLITRTLGPMANPHVKADSHVHLVLPVFNFSFAVWLLELVT